MSYKAEGLSRVFQTDPQMQLPLRPRFSEDYFVMPLGETAMMIAGGEKAEVFRGKSAALLLPHLLPLLDGTRTFEDLDAALPSVAPKVLRDAVSLLYFRGLLEEGETEEDRAALTDEERERYDAQLRFFGRFIDVNRISRNRYGAQRLVMSARVLIVGEGPLAADIAASVIRAGAGALTVVTSDGERDRVRALVGLNPSCELTIAGPDDDLDRILAAQTLVVAVGTRDAVSRWSDLDARCRRMGIAWMRCVANEERAEVGPIFTSAETACYRCWVEWNELRDEEGGESVEVPMAATSFLELAVGFELSKIFLTNLCDRTRRLDLATGAVTEQRVIRLPRCSACGTGHDTGAPALVLPDDLAAAYHLQTNHKWHGTNKKAHQVHYSEHVADLNQGAFKIYRTLPKLALPPLEEGLPLAHDLGAAFTNADAPARPCDLESLAKILGWTARWRDPNGAPLRFVPSGGGLCASDLYVIAWDIDGLPAGIYHYEGAQHRLELLREGDVREELRAMVNASLVDGTRAAIVQTMQIARFHSKYGPRAYRYGHLDAGVMTMSLRLLGRAAGVRLRNTPAFADDALTELLALPLHQELPTQIVFAGDAKEGTAR
jgi:SagB-type dehydrogenase family enzyme